MASAIAVIARDQVIAVIGNRAGPSLSAQKRGISALTLHYSEFDSDLTYADPVPQSMVSESLQNWQGYSCTSNPPIVKNSPIQAISQTTTS